MFRTFSRLAAAALLLAAGACSDSNDDRPSGTMPAPPPNTQTLNVTLSAAEVIGGGAPAGSATATLTLDLDDGTLTGTVTLSGITADGVTLNRGFAGETGPVLITMESQSATEWTVPGGAALDADGEAALAAGALYLQVTSAALPGGALRGQIITGDTVLLFTVLTGAQEVPPVTSSGTATAAVTLDPDTGSLVIHVNTAGLDDAVAAHIHQALAGRNGGVLVELAADPAAVSHWFADGVTLDAAGLGAFEEGALYVNVHTPAHPPGEVRGQIVPDGIELVFTQLTGDDVVPPVTTANSGVAATTIASSAQTVTTHVNLAGLDDTTAVTVNQAPVGQNGPAAFSLDRNPNDITQWSLEGQDLSAAQYMALRNQGLYLTAATPAWPMGEVRGQIAPAMSAPGGGATFLVDAVVPANGATVAALPGTIDVSFNRAVLTDSAGTDQVELLASGGDGSFGDAQDLLVPVAAVDVDGATMRLDLTGATDADDVYQLTLDGSSADPITDLAGTILDGDRDGAPGGNFVSTFTVAAPSTAPTLTEIQAETFSVSCAVSGCHAGGSPAQGLNLSAGQTFANTVNVPSNEMPSLDRVEPGDPDASFLVRKVEGTAGVGARMPLGQPPLSNQQIQNIRNWILDGARDN